MLCLHNTVCVSYVGAVLVYSITCYIRLCFNRTWLYITCLFAYRMILDEMTPMWFHCSMQRKKSPAFCFKTKYCHAGVWICRLSPQNLYGQTVGALLLIWIYLILVWISNYVHYEMWDEITYLSPNFHGATTEVWDMQTFPAKFVWPDCGGPFADMDLLNPSMDK